LAVTRRPNIVGGAAESTLSLGRRPTSLVADGVSSVGLGGFISVYGQIRTTRLEHQLAQQREAQSREAKAKAIITKYRDPLLKSAFDFQSRLFSIVQLGFLRIYSKRTQTDTDYAIKNTLYVIAEFLGWVEILRQEVRFLDLGDIEANKRLEELLSNIKETFLTDGMDLTFRLFRGEQRAIGEIMIVERETKDDKLSECMGFAEFVQRLDDPLFSKWFSKLEKDIAILAGEVQGHEQRLIALQHTLIDLIDFLDPDCSRVPKSYRTKIASVRQV